MSIHLRKIAMKKPRSKYLFGISLVFGTLLYFHLFQPHLLYGYADMTEVKGWEMNRSRNSSLYVRPLVQTTIMSGLMFRIKKINSNEKPPHNTLLVIPLSSVLFLIK
uniref:Uncharacterized protein n=1 Tax=Cacopsylla melanoneura TaxID=428564 RepID=A0A8D8ZRF2_9HEMI